MILFVDDEPRIMNSLRQYLEAQLKPHGYEVVFHNNVDTAWDFFEKHIEEIDLVILDIMMPPEKQFSTERTNGGLKTGLFFYKRIRARTQEMPVILFTNFSDEDVEKRLRQEDRKARFLQKANYLLLDFVDEVKRMLGLPVSER